MRFGQLVLVASVLLLPLSASASATPKGRGVSAPTHAAKPKAKSKVGIDSARATEIQTALIKAGYLTGTPSATWDAASQAAMEKLQADNGWQTKIVPDARALIKLGLGPNSAQAAPIVATVPATEDHEEQSSEPAAAAPAASNR